MKHSSSYITAEMGSHSNSVTVNPFGAIEEQSGESGLAAQILNSASSLRHSRSDDKIGDRTPIPADHRLSLTDTHLIEHQTRVSFKALFGETIQPDSVNHPRLGFSTTSGARAHLRFLKVCQICYSS